MIRERKVDERGFPVKDPNCIRCGSLGEKPGLLCTDCKMHYRTKYGVMVAVKKK